MGKHQHGSDWIVVQTHAHRECVALRHLERQSFAAYCPMLRVTIRHARRTRQTLKPLFPGYVFASVDQATARWRALLSTHGVRTVVCTGERPCYLPHGFVETLAEREVDGAIVKPTTPYRIGQCVRVANGPLDGFVATIVAMDERQRLVVLLDLLNGPTRVRLDASSVSDVLVQSQVPARHQSLVTST